VHRREYLDLAIGQLFAHRAAAVGGVAEHPPGAAIFRLRVDERRRLLAVVV
jgi:hypothetical protein